MILQTVVGQSSIFNKLSAPIWNEIILCWKDSHCKDFMHMGSFILEVLVIALTKESWSMFHFTVTPSYIYKTPSHYDTVLLWNRLVIRPSHDYSYTTVLIITPSQYNNVSLQHHFIIPPSHYDTVSLWHRFIITSFHYNTASLYIQHRQILTMQSEHKL